MTISDLSRAVWRTSRHSQQNGACVEVATAQGAIAVRDSRDPQGPALIIPRSAWREFNERVKRGAYDA
ncbi:DUF397 domain-containing protein [Spirillospora sp. CA-255316]